METTVGHILINEYLPPDVRDYQKTMTASEMKSTLKKVADKHPQHYGTITKALKDIGDLHSYLEGSSFTFDEMKPHDITPIYKKWEPELNKAKKVADPLQRDNAMRAVNMKIEGELNSLVESHMKDSKNSVHKWSTIGGKGNRNNIRQMFYASGNQIDVANKVLPHMSRSNFSQGLAPSDIFISATGARKGIVESFISVRDPGALGKEFFMLTNHLVTTEHDCGTPEGIVVQVDSPDALDRHLAKDAGHYKRNDNVTKLVQADLKKSNVSSIVVRSPLTCRSKHGVCAMCVGELENGRLSHIGDTVGLRSAQSLTEKLTQMALSSKHTGGVVGKKSAFDTVKQLMHVPENFPGGAVLSQLHGTVQKIEDAPDGGKRVWVGDKMHYLDPKLNLSVKKGDTLTAGDAISDGLINPAEIVRLKGMDQGRLYLARAMQKVYSDSGIHGHPKVFETVSRAILNLAEVEDPGDHDFNIGDKVNWNANIGATRTQYAKVPVDSAVGWRAAKDYPSAHVKEGEFLTYDHASKLGHLKEIEVMRKPAKIRPVMYGTERAAIYGGDWISNLGFRFVKDQLKTNVALGAKADIHGWSPIPAYIYGAEFGKGEGGRF